MFDIFGIKKLKMENQKLEQEIIELREVVVRLNTANKQLVKENDEIKEEYRASFEQTKAIKAQLDEANMKLKNMLNTPNTRSY